MWMQINLLNATTCLIICQWTSWFSSSIPWSTKPLNTEVCIGWIHYGTGWFHDCTSQNRKKDSKSSNTFIHDVVSWMFLVWHHLLAVLWVTLKWHWGDKRWQCCYNSFLSLPEGPGTASDGPGERWAAHHIIRATHNGTGHVRGSGANHNAGPCIWSPGTTAGKG